MPRNGNRFSPIRNGTPVGREAGFSCSTVRTTGYTYTIDYWQNGYIISQGGKQTKKAYAYEIHVKKSWNREEIILRGGVRFLFDGLNTFKAQLNARLLEFNDNEEGYTTISHPMRGTTIGRRTLRSCRAARA